MNHSSEGQTGLIAVVKAACLGDGTPKSNPGPPGWGLGHRANSPIPGKNLMLKSLIKIASVIMEKNGFCDTNYGKGQWFLGHGMYRAFLIN